MPITFRIIDTDEGARAYEWHRGFSGANDAIFPRSRADFAEMVFDRCVWWGLSSDDEILAMSYAHFDRESDTWEIGGAMVAAQARRKGLGGLIMRLPLAHTLLNESSSFMPSRSRILAHVLEDNEEPRKIVTQLGFEFARHVEIPASKLPGLRAKDGMIRGDEFSLNIPEALDRLAQWAADWNNLLKDGTPAKIDMIDGATVDRWPDEFRDLAAAYRAQAGGAEAKITASKGSED